MIGRLFAKSKPALVEVPKVDPSERVYAVGDIHGRHDLLDMMFEKIAADHSSRPDGRSMRIVFLGDYVDRGDNSREVLERLAMVQERMPDEAVCLSGNHEAAMLDFLDAPEKGADWLDFGGMQTLGSYGVAPPRDKSDVDQLKVARDAFQIAISDHLPFLRSLRSMYRSGDVLFVHAGVNPERPLDNQSDRQLLWGSGNTPEGPVIPGIRIIHGHYDRAEPIVAPLRVCVDTGAYYSGRLTAIRLDDGEGFVVADVLDA